MFDKNKSREELEVELKRSMETNRELRATLKNNEEFHNEFIANERFLSKNAMELVEIPENMDIHEFAASKLELIFKNSIIMVTSYDEKTDDFGLACIKGLDEKKRDLLEKIMGKDFLDTKVPFGSMDEIIQKCLYRKTFKKLKNGLYVATGGAFPKKLCKLIEKSTGIKEVCGMSLLWDNKLYGAVAIFSYNENTLEKKDTVETLVSMVSVALQRKQAQNKIKKALKEKELLMKEIHHRSKNNLMVISSILSLQSRHIKDRATREIFQESRDRARSMAIIHEQLYTSTDLKRINFGDYIRALTSNLFKSYMDDSRSIKLNLNIEDLMLDVNTAVPLGLIVNELVTNCMKYAFPIPEGRESANNGFDSLAAENSGPLGHHNNEALENQRFSGRQKFYEFLSEINLEFYRDDDKFVLSVADNGVGIPDDLDFWNTNSFGLQLVNSLTDQIQGEIELDMADGTEFKITFKEFEE